MQTTHDAVFPLAIYTAEGGTAVAKITQKNIKPVKKYCSLVEEEGCYPLLY